MGILSGVGRFSAPRNTDKFIAGHPILNPLKY